MTAPSSGPQWSGDMLDRPEMVEAFATQLRKALVSHADYVAAIRRDAEAMWDNNPPEGYGRFEEWWRARWVKGPLAEIQEHLEDAARLTFKLEARYRKGRHVLPAKRRATAAAKEGRKAPELGGGTRSTGTAPRPGTAPPLPPATDTTSGAGFMDLIRRSS